MRRCSLCATTVLLLLLFLSTASASAATFAFLTDPFAGSSALTDPGRQIVGGEDFITFSTLSDVFLLNPSAFGVTEILFANEEADNLPLSDVNTIVLRSFPVPLAAGTAANLIAEQVTAPGPGFFIYFNSGLDLPRLVYSTDLSDNTADLKILFRLTNLTGQDGRDAMSTFTAGTFALTPEPSSFVLLVTGGLLLGGSSLARRRQRKARGQGAISSI